EYGVNDFPLIIQDKKMDDSGNIQYTPNMTDTMRGLLGNAFLVNGAMEPFLEVPKGIVRLRLLNGSNSRTYHFSLDNDQNFYQIASDGGFLEQPIEKSTLRLSPAERAEILVDFSQFETGEKISLINTTSGVIDSASKRSEEHTSELQSRFDLVCRLLLEKKKMIQNA